RRVVYGFPNSRYITFQKSTIPNPHERQVVYGFHEKRLLLVFNLDVWKFALCVTNNFKRKNSRRSHFFFAFFFFFDFASFSFKAASSCSSSSSSWSKRTTVPVVSTGAGSASGRRVKSIGIDMKLPSPNLETVLAIIWLKFWISFRNWSDVILTTKCLPTTS